MFAGKDFKNIYNLSGGIKAWQKEVAVGPEDSGMFLFGANFTPESAIITGFGLEMGLRDFYLSMKEKVKSEAAGKIFSKLADIEILHQNQLLQLYGQVTGEDHSLESFAEKVVHPVMEGGLSTEEYLGRYSIDLEEELEVLGLALAIEAQALDLYHRAAEKSDSSGAQKVLLQIADEERNHIAYLGDYIDQLEMS